MSAHQTDARERLVEYHIEDASDRLRFQQEFSVAGFRTLILVNGGAVIALLTYAGNANDKVAATNFQWAFAGYILGLVCAVFAYLPAYLGQAQIMQYSAAQAFETMGIQKMIQRCREDACAGPISGSPQR